MTGQSGCLVWSGVEYMLIPLLPREICQTKIFHFKASIFWSTWRRDATLSPRGLEARLPPIPVSTMFEKLLEVKVN